MDTNQLARQALDQRLDPLRQTTIFTRPARGWLKAIREALGMTTTQFGQRLGLSQSRISRLEKHESEGTVTLKTLREAAEALDCQLVYALIPNRPLEEMLRARAAQMADRQLARVGHTMALENQSLDRQSLAIERERLTEELLRGSPRRLWDEP
jgi:predicted DNA-binding mobile mystery protein A